MAEETKTSPEETMDTVTINPDAAQQDTDLDLAKFNSWEVSSMSEEDQVKWFQNQFTPIYIEIILKNDKIEEMIVLSNLYNAAAKALENIVPEDFEIHEDFKKILAANNIDETALLQKVNQHGAATMVRSAVIDQLRAPEEQPAEYQFIRLVTMMARQEMILGEWDRQLGFTDSLRRSNIPMMPTLQEMRQLFFTTKLLEVIGQKSSQAVQVPNQGSVMYEPSD